MIEAAQKWSKVLGLYGCYFLSLLKVAEDVARCAMDPLREFDQARRNGTVGDDAFVNDAAKLFNGFWPFPISYTVTKAGDGHPLPLDYQLVAGEREILRFEYVDATGKTWVHFVVGDGSQRCAYDPEGSSNSVTKGRVVSRRIIRRS